MTICPRLQPGKRRGNSTVASGWGSRGSLTACETIRCRPVPLSATRIQTQHCFNSHTTWLTGLSGTQQPVGFSEIPSDLSGHISAASHFCTSCTESRAWVGEYRWRTSSEREWLKVGAHCMNIYDVCFIVLLICQS